MIDLYILNATNQRMASKNNVRERLKVFFDPVLFDKVSTFVIKEDRKLLDELAKR